MPHDVSSNGWQRQTRRSLLPIPWAACLLALTSILRGETLHGLNQEIDLNDAVNPGACILWNWNGTGADEMVMVDVIKHRLVTMGTDPPYLWTIDPVATRASVTGSPFSLLRCDVNSDNHDDLILIDGDRYRVWLFKIRTQPGEVAADIEGTLPISSSPAFHTVAAGDLESDGQPDLLIHSGIGTRPWLLFDFATAAPEARQLMEVTSVKDADIHPWDPAGRPGPGILRSGHRLPNRGKHEDLSSVWRSFAVTGGRDSRRGRASGSGRAVPSGVCRFQRETENWQRDDPREVR